MKVSIFLVNIFGGSAAFGCEYIVIPFPMDPGRGLPPQDLALEYHVVTLTE